MYSYTYVRINKISREIDRDKRKRGRKKEKESKIQTVIMWKNESGLVMGITLIRDQRKRKNMESNYREKDRGKRETKREK